MVIERNASEIKCFMVENDSVVLVNTEQRYEMGAFVEKFQKYLKHKVLLLLEKKQ